MSDEKDETIKRAIRVIEHLACEKEASKSIFLEWEDRRNKVLGLISHHATRFPKENWDTIMNDLYKDVVALR